MTEAMQSLFPLRCPHPDKCGQEGCHGCQEPVTSRNKPHPDLSPMGGGKRWDDGRYPIGWLRHV